MLKAKAVCVRDLDQTGPPLRHDRRHLQLVARCLPHFLTQIHAEAIASPQTEVSAAKIFSRAFALLADKRIAPTLQAERIDFASLLPPEFAESPVARIRAALHITIRCPGSACPLFRPSPLLFLRPFPLPHPSALTWSCWRSFLRLPAPPLRRFPILSPSPLYSPACASGSMVFMPPSWPARSPPPPLCLCSIKRAPLLPPPKRQTQPRPSASLSIRLFLLSSFFRLIPRSGLPQKMRPPRSLPTLGTHRPPRSFPTSRGAATSPRTSVCPYDRAGGVQRAGPSPTRETCYSNVTTVPILTP